MRNPIHCRTKKKKNKLILLYMHNESATVAEVSIYHFSRQIYQVQANISGLMDPSFKNSNIL